MNEILTPTAPIIIHQMGKVASLTIRQTLQNVFVGGPIFHTHMLTNATWNNISKWLACPVSKGEEEFRESWREQIESGKNLRKLIDEYKKLIDAGFITQRLNVITLVRDPVAITLACLFQSLKLHFPNVESRCENEPLEQIVADIKCYFLNYINLFFEKRAMPDTPQWLQFKSWLTRRPHFFDDELRKVFDIDVYGSIFDYSKGYGIYEGKYARVLLIRVEDLNRVASTAFRDFLGIEQLELINTNIGSQKFYKDLYSEFKKTNFLPEAFVDYHYSWKFARHFYSSEELGGFRRKWLRKTTSGHFVDAKANKFIATDLNRKGEELFIQGDTASAFKLFQESIKCEPDSAIAHNNLGVVFWQDGNRKAATQHFQRALELDPDYRKAVINASHAFLELGFEEQALNLYLAYLKRHPEDRHIAAAMEKLAGQKALTTNGPETTLNSIEKDAIVIVIDVSDSMGQFSSKALDGWQDYYEENMVNLCSLLEYCNRNNIKIQETLYYGQRNSRLDHIKFDYTLNDRLDYSKFSHIYFCGASLDQCVIIRPLGYFNIDHPNKTIITNCSFQGVRFCVPIDHGIRKIPYKADGIFNGIFNSMEELHRHVDDFLRVNGIEFRDWVVSQKRVSVNNRLSSETDEKLCFAQTSRIESILRSTDNIKGLLSEKDRTILVNASLSANGPAIEIGCLAGLSTWCIALALDNSDTLISVDPFRVEYLSDLAKGVIKDISGEGTLKKESFFDSWEAQVSPLLRAKKVIPICGNSMEVVSQVKESLSGQQAGLLFIDALHDYEAVKKDVESYLPLVKQGGIVVFHDYQQEWGVWEAVNEAIEEGLLEKVNDAYTLVTRKKVGKIGRNDRKLMMIRAGVV